MAGQEPLLRVVGLRTQLFTRGGVVRAVDGVDLELSPGQTLGVVGESGCGKTMLALSILRLVPEPGRIVSGRVLLEGRDLLTVGPDELRSIRGKDLAMSFQDPITALDPIRRVGSQLREAMTAHDRFRQVARARTGELLDRVGIPGAATRVRDYPHQFSGGMRQRLLIAIGISNQPRLLIADEATTALDVTSQAQLVGMLKELNLELGMAIVLVSHNMAVVAGLCDRVAVMYAGRIVEEGPAGLLFSEPQHPYTWHLLRSVARIDSPRRQRLTPISGAPPDLARLPRGCKFNPRCEFQVPRCSVEEPPLAQVGPAQLARCWVLMGTVDRHRRRATTLPRPSGAPLASQVAVRPAIEPAVILQVEDVRKHFRTPGGRGGIRAVDGVSLEVHAGETLGLIGESGCGKSTLARILTGLIAPTSGVVSFAGRDIARLHPNELRQLRQRLQMVFQDPFSSLNPRMKVADIVGEPLSNLSRRSSVDRRAQVSSTLNRVGLSRRHGERYPHELSGGQRQRVGIARALVVEPSVIVADEPVSALDASIQAQIVSLLQDLQAELGLTYVLISHDLSVVRSLADRIAVMYLGKLVELADNEALYRSPQHPYTAALLSAVPIADPGLQPSRSPLLLPGEPPSPTAPPAGCRFHPRCPIARVPGPCDRVEPELAPSSGAPGRAACHFAGEVRLQDP